MPDSVNLEIRKSWKRGKGRAGVTLDQYNARILETDERAA
jgi:hypothetical protein